MPGTDGPVAFAEFQVVASADAAYDVVHPGGRAVPIRFGKEESMETTYPDLEQAMQALGPMAVLIIVVMALVLSLAVVIIKAVIYCKVFSKAGYHWALGLLALIPILSIIMPFVLAFGQWPIRAELEELRRQLPQSPPPLSPV